MPTQVDELRAQHQFVRGTILRDEYDETLREWMDEHVDTEVLEVWGIPDTSANPLADLSRQLTIPGLYGKRPRWRHADMEKNRGLIGPGGFLDTSGYHTRSQFVQYMTIGMGDYLVRMDVDANGDLTVRPVSPHNIFVWVDSQAPEIPLGLGELMLRWWEEREVWIYTWDIYDLGDKKAGRPASYSIREAVDNGEIGGLGDDLSNVFLVKPDGTTGALVGDEYPWVRKNGTTRLPYNFKHAVDTGMTWNEHDKRGVHRGTLNTGLYWSYTGHTALSATGSMVFVAGLEPTNVDVQAPESSITTTSVRGLRTLKTTPGAIIYHVLQEGAEPFVKEIGPGGNLEELANFATRYEQRQAIRFGLNPADAERQAANPMSGISMFLSRQEKREYSEFVEPLFRRSDLDAVELAAIVLRAAGTADFDEDGYTVVYAEVPRSPMEERERRENLQWQIDRGLISKAEMFQRLNPGTSEEDAVTALVESQVSNARVDSQLAERLEEEGLASPADEAEVAFNELTLAAERLARLGDLDGVNQLRRELAEAIGETYAGDLTSLPTDTPPAAAAAEE